MKMFYSLSLQGNQEDHAVETVGFEAQQRIPTSRDNIVSMESVDTYEAGRPTSLCFQVAGFIKKLEISCRCLQKAMISRVGISIWLVLRIHSLCKMTASKIKLVVQPEMMQRQQRGSLRLAIPGRPGKAAPWEPRKQRIWGLPLLTRVTAANISLG